MGALSAKPEHGSGERKAGPLVFIRQKLERVLHRNGAVSAYRAEVVSIIDTLDSINRDVSGLQKRSHPGRPDRD